MNKPTNRYITVNHAADILSVAPKTIRNWIDQGTLPAYTVGSTAVRLREQDIHNLIHRTEPK